MVRLDTFTLRFFANSEITVLLLMDMDFTNVIHVNIYFTLIALMFGLDLSLSVQEARPTPLAGD